MDASAYLQNPCEASSLPFWKTNRIQVPKSLLILREDDPRLETARREYQDTPYFKIMHPMDHTDRPALPNGYRFIRPDENVLAAHIAACYTDMGASVSELKSYRLHPVFCPDLWLAIVEERTGEVVASGIAELDGGIREGVLEWIQVSPARRRQGWGRRIVCEFLYRMQGRADFVTVSVKENDPSIPRALYESCGFRDGVVWHVLH